MQSLDALNALANENRDVLRCLARVDGARKLDRVSEIIRMKRAKLGHANGNVSGNGNGTGAGGGGGGGAGGGPRYTRDQIHQLRVRCSTLKQRLRYRNRERRDE